MIIKWNLFTIIRINKKQILLLNYWESKTYEGGCASVEVDYWIPNWMQVFNITDCWEFEEVTTGVSFRVLGVKSGGGVEWLMNISNIVNHKSQGLRLSNLFVSNILNHCLIDEGFLIVPLASEPLLDIWNSISNIVVIKLKVRVVLDRTALIKVRSVDKVPIWLPRTASCLDLVCISCTLHEWVLVLQLSSAGVHLLEDLQDRSGFVQSLRIEGL